MKCVCGGKQRTLDSRGHYNATAERNIRAKAKEVLALTKNYTWRRRQCVVCGKIQHTIELPLEIIRKLREKNV